MANQDFLWVVDWAEGNASYSYVNFGNHGIIKITYSDGVQKILWHDKWIIEITALKATDMSSSVLLDQVIDNLRIHWMQIENKQS